MTSVKRPLFFNGINTIVIEPIHANVLSKILNENFISLTSITKGRNAFSIVSREDIVEEVSKELPFADCYKLRCKGNTIRYITKDKVRKNEDLFLNKYKVLISKSAGAPGKDLKIIGKPYIGEPGTACTDSLIPIGDFATKEEAENLQKYIYSKFLRYIVGILKVSQNVSQNVPMQDFTNNSDIDWSRSISEIDDQLFKKYNLNEEEITHIKKSIKEME